jgi:hypothetical protein
MIGRGAGLLAELAVDLQPMGWRFVDRRGRDAHRTSALLREDLDELAEAFGRLRRRPQGADRRALDPRLPRSGCTAVNVRWSMSARPVT